ncbi:TIGR02677 family protein [Pseudonocardia lacus]|uniref:TIGR02677 family protein n=1 Tax=Pseudonocardia lacus TaxID=2835865 RepID=UPI0027E3122E|nr:TIGR02677 family protein [Pseudonocardia lacus]
MPRRLPTEVFRFAVGDRSDLYTAILQAFAHANDRLETALGVDDVRAGLRDVGWYSPLDDDELTAALRSLGEWQLLEITQNHAGGYRTAEEYERRNLQYSLSRRGEAAFAGVQQALLVLASSGALQTAVLDAIADRLAEIAGLLADPAVPDRRVYSAVVELETHLDALRTGTKRFNGELQRLVRSEGADTDTFHEVKAATVGYLQEFLTNLDRRTSSIADGVDRVEALGTDGLWDRALRGAELPPTAGEAARESWLQARRGHWDGLRAWFRPRDAAPARVEHLHTVARRAIVALLQVLDRIVESRKRASSAVEDFRELARWFAAAPTEDDLHLLWAAAFGAGPARHAHLAHPDPELVAASTSWHDAPPVPVSALLRSSGRVERFTRTGRVRDVAALKAERAARARAERAELDSAWDLLSTGGPVRLSRFARLDHSVFEHLLDLIGRALAAAPDAEGVRRGGSADGRTEILLRNPPDAAVAVVRTPRGQFEGPDFVVDIRTVRRRRAPEAVTG